MQQRSHKRRAQAKRLLGLRTPNLVSAAEIYRSAPSPIIICLLLFVPPWGLDFPVRVLRVYDGRSDLRQARGFPRARVGGREGALSASSRLSEIVLHGFLPVRNGQDGHVRFTHLRTSSAEPPQQSRHLARIGSRSARRRQARSQRRMPRRAASFLNQANRHPDSPGSTERSARTGAHSLAGVRCASTTTSSTARLPGAASTIVMRPSVTARRAARRG